MLRPLAGFNVRCSRFPFSAADAFGIQEEIGFGLLWRNSYFWVRWKVFGS